MSTTNQLSNFLAGASLKHPTPADGQLVLDSQDGSTSALIPTPRPSNHAPSIASLADGSFIVAWFGGSDEGNQDIDIIVSRFDPESGTWTDAHAVTGDKVNSDQNPGIFVNREDDIWLLYTSQVSRQAGIQEDFNLQFTAVVRRIRSADGGRTWSQPEDYFDRPGTFARQPIQRLSNGRLVHGQWLCFDDDSKNGSDQPVAAFSDDEGETWSWAEFPEGHGRVHPNIVELDGGKLLCFFRSRWADWVYISRSDDFGQTWTTPIATDIPNNNAGISALKLPSGRIAVFSNEEQVNTGPGEVIWPYERTKLTVRVSSDEGTTWPVGRAVEAGDGYSGAANSRSNRRHEYPHAILDSTGRIHVTWAFQSRRAIMHRSFTEDWIDGTPDNVHTDCKLWG